MNIPLQLFVFCIPSLVYVLVCRRRGAARGEAFSRVGWSFAGPVHYLWGLGIILLTGGLSWAVLRFVPAAVLEDPRVNISAALEMEPGLKSIAAVLWQQFICVALGEEVFFRGFLGGWLVRCCGFAAGNTVQALLFTAPHLLLLGVSTALLPLVLVQLATGWLLGWLRWRSGSILPGWIAHGLANSSSFLIAML